MLDEANALVMAGLPILPLRPCGKAPATPRGVHDASTDRAVIASWWETMPDANIGIATGPKSRIWVLDVDAKTQGPRSLRILEGLNGELPSTVRSRTGGGGFHLYFRLEDEGQTIRSLVGVVPGIDVKSHGGYVVAPPSRHESGREYYWEEGQAPGEIEFAFAPGWLIDIVKSAGSQTLHGSRSWGQIAPDGEVHQGQRNNALARISGHLFRRYADPELATLLVRAFNETYCKPPLPESEVMKTVASIGQAELRRRGTSS